MIVLLNTSGQLANRLRSLAAFVALGLEYKKKVVCPVVSKQILNNFVLSPKNKNFKFYNSKPLLFCTKLLNFKNKIFGEKNERIKPNKHFQVFSSWLNFLEPNLLNKHYDEIKKILNFKPQIIKKCKNDIVNINSQNRVLIGVHFRRGDYKFWRNGKFYFTVEEFTSQMIALNEEFDNPLFLIFSNEKISIEIFEKSGLNNVIIMKGSAVEDLCCMSMVDYIIGPPSTYSSWAAYIGNKNLLWMKEHNVIYSKSDFKKAATAFTGELDFY